VLRFNLLADPIGSTVHLPATTGQVGPVASWEGPDGTWVTYLNLPATQGAAPGARFLVKVTPAESK